MHYIELHADPLSLSRRRFRPEDMVATAAGLGMPALPTRP